MTGQPRRTDGDSHDLLTVLAIAIVVYVLAKLVHEGVGHGLACILTGGELQGVASSWCDCSKEDVSLWGHRTIKGAGTALNLLAGSAALAALLRRRFRSGAAHYFVWLTAAVQIFMGGGYLMVDPIFRFGDWGAFVQGLPAESAWRIGLASSGIAVTLAAFFALRSPFERLLPPTERRKREAFILCWLPYFGVGGLIMTAAAFLNVLGPEYAMTSAAATIGGTFMSVWIPVAVDATAPAGPSIERLVIRREPAWIAVGAVALVFLACFFGPGISL